MSSATTSDPLDFIEADEQLSASSESDDDISLMENFNPVADHLQSELTSIATSAPSETVIPTQLAQWVYIQTPPKITMSTASLNKTNPTNIVLNSCAPIQISNLSNSKNIPLAQPIAQPTNQNVILAHPVNKPQHVYIQKPVSMVPVSMPANSVQKNSLTYLTMIKPTQQVGIPTNNQKFVIAPLPKFTNSRIPATVTTNCVQSKIALMPISLHNTVNKNQQSTKHKVFNLKIMDGQLQTEGSGSGGITVMCDNKFKNGQNELHYQYNNLYNEALDNAEDKKESVEDKSYELSIVEDSNSTNDVSLIINTSDDKDKTKTLPYREPPKLQKHGVSILKKNYNLETKSEKSGSLIISPIPNSITTISDVNTKEIKISTNSNFNSESSVIPEPKVPPQKAERRRKSSFTCRKDYDEITVTHNFWTGCKMSTNVVEKPITCSNSKNVDVIEDCVEIGAIKEDTDINMNEEFDAKKVLKWEDGIGTLPGSSIRFQINEFGFLEYLKNDEYNKMLEKKTCKTKDKKNDLQEEMRCLRCGCYGLPSEFITSKYCSYDCKEVGEKNAKEKEIVKLKRKKTLIKKSSDLNARETKPEKEESISEDSTSNDCSQDKYNYPWHCTKKGFSWSKYLEHVKAKAAPVKFFKDPFPYNRNGFRPGMKLEGIDPQHPSHFCVLSVAEVIGYRMRLHFDGYSENYDIWANADSMDIFPVGWCEKYGHVLHPPPSHRTDFSWTTYLKHTKGTVAPKHLFANRAGSAICPNGFRVGMKLEAVDRKNSSLVCVATVLDMMDNRILVHFDSWDDIYDYWADPTSPYIHPVSWADQNGHSLTPPNDYPNPSTFTWEKYLKEIKATPAPVRAFKQKPVYGFKRGMRLECVDKRVPQLIRVATVEDTREHQIRVSFDGWPDRYSYWVDNDSTDIHPVGWCQKTGHPIEPPLTPNDVYDFLECPTVGCRGQGHIGGPKLSTHSTTTDCPYSDDNLGKDHILPDRLLSPDRQPEAVVPVSREPKEKTKTRGRPPKIPRLDPPIKTEWINDDADGEDSKPLKRKNKISFKNHFFEKSTIKALPLSNGYDNEYAEQIWEKHSRHLRKYVKKSFDPRDWEEDDVVQFIASLPYCEKHSALFKQHKIDGEALLMLNQHDLIDILRIKLGPAIKLYCIIMLLRRNILS